MPLMVSQLLYARLYCNLETVVNWIKILPASSMLTYYKVNSIISKLSKETWIAQQ